MEGGKGTTLPGKDQWLRQVVLYTLVLGGVCTAHLHPHCTWGMPHVSESSQAWQPPYLPTGVLTAPALTTMYHVRQYPIYS